MMKSILNKDGKFICTVDGEINANDPAFQGCTIVDGDQPLRELRAKIFEEGEELRRINIELIAANDKYIEELAERVRLLESL